MLFQKKLKAVAFINLTENVKGLLTSTGIPKAAKYMYLLQPFKDCCLGQIFVDLILFYTCII